MFQIWTFSHFLIASVLLLCSTATTTEIASYIPANNVSKNISLLGNIRSAPHSSPFLNLTEPRSFGTGLLQVTQPVPRGSTAFSVQLDVYIALQQASDIRGVAIWLTKEMLTAVPTSAKDSAIGMPKQWNGLVLFVEPSSNVPNSVRIRGIWNNGNVNYSQQDDAAGKMTYHFVSTERVVPKSGRFTVAVEYSNRNTLVVKMSTGDATGTGNEMIECFRKEQLNLDGFGWAAVSGQVGERNYTQPIRLYSFQVTSSNEPVATNNDINNNNNNVNESNASNSKGNAYESIDNTNINGNIQALSARLDALAAQLSAIDRKLSANQSAIDAVASSVHKDTTLLTKSISDNVTYGVRHAVAGDSELLRKNLNVLSSAVSNVEERIVKMQNSHPANVASVSELVKQLVGKVRSLVLVNVVLSVTVCALLLRMFRMVGHGKADSSASGTKKFI